jgi:hypothetical protein
MTDSTIFGGEGKNLKSSEGSSGFDLHGSTYAGPENMVPTNKGIVNPDDVSKKEVKAKAEV